MQQSVSNLSIQQAAKRGIRQDQADVFSTGRVQNGILFLGAYLVMAAARSVIELFHFSRGPLSMLRHHDGWGANLDGGDSTKKLLLNNTSTTDNSGNNQLHSLWTLLQRL